MPGSPTDEAPSSDTPSSDTPATTSGTVPAAPTDEGTLPDAPTSADPPPAQGCAPPSVAPLFARGAELPPIVEQRADGVIVTRGAGRVRGRHELEGTYSPFGPLYFENRSYAFTIEDQIAAGGDTVTFSYRPEAPVSANGPGTNFRYFKIYGDGNVFHSNVTMGEVTPQELVYPVDRNAREGRELRAGDLLEFEFGIFIAGQDAGDPNAIEGRTSYYTDTFRYRVGEGGLTPFNADDSGQRGPDEDAWLAGATTIPWIYAEPELYFSQLALNTQPETVQPMLRGRRLFHTDFGSGEHGEEGNPLFAEQAGKLGPLTSAAACVDCHERDGRGQLPELGGELGSVVVKLYGPAELGNQLQREEGVARLERFEERTVELADGTQIVLQRPVFAFEGVGVETLAPSVRVARQLPALGLLEAIAEADILARADELDCDGDGISGRAQVVLDPESGEMRLGRFGWKAEKVSLAHQVADALDADLSVTSPLLPGDDGSAELAQDDFDDLVAYARLLALPARRDVDDPEVMRGEALFAEIGCIHCHAPSATTGRDHPFAELREQTIRPYTDLLVHDMGPDLADDSGSSAQAREWRTPPLWGLGLLQTVNGHSRLLHDGRARDPIEAALWHGGEAAFASAAVIGLSASERQALLAFLLSL
jgi:CxxC motif-containing protein (DUF1111 family)